MRCSTKLLTALLACLLFGTISAIDFRPGSSQRVEPKEYNFHYHNGTNDYQWFSSSTNMRWAVMFNLREAYPASYNAHFTVTKAFVYFPQIANSATVKLFPNNHGQPANVSPLATVTSSVTSNNMTFSFPNSVVVDTVWMVVEYDTDMFGPYIAASAGGGTHSYYQAGSETNSYYQNMEQSGFQCEFLFGLGGDFVTTGIDLALLDVDLEGSLVIQGRVRPTFRIYNHSDSEITNASINLKITSPVPDQVIHESIIPISNPIPPRSELIVNPSTPGYQLPTITLSRNPMQIRIRATLSSEYDTLDIAANNTIVSYKNVFSAPMPLFLVENFARYADFPYITGLQDQLEDTAFQPLFYLPILTDTLSQIGALQRFNAYGYNSLPLTVIQGDAPIIGSHATDYGNLYLNATSAAATSKTFISTMGCVITHPGIGDYLRLQFTLSNSNTQMYSGTTDQNLTSLSRLYVGLFNKISIHGRDRMVFRKWISYADTINTAITIGSSINKTYIMGLDNISVSDMNRDYVLFVWLQRADSHEILYANSQNFASVVGNDDEYVTELQISVYPNPLRNNGFLSISYDTKSQIRSLKTTIYNLRGQKIKEFPELNQFDKHDHTIPAQDFPTSGIYFIRTQCIDAKGTSTTYLKKISIIK